MRFVPTSCIREGMIVGKSLRGRNGEILLQQGTPLRSSFIDKILNLGYNGIYVDDEMSKDIEVVEVISEQLRQKAIKTVKETFISMDKTQTLKTEQIKDLKNIIENIVDELFGNPDMVVNMVDMKIYDDYTFFHSTNVAILSLVVGVAAGLNKYDLHMLGMAAILHDIGKVYIPKDILNKNGKLTDEEMSIMKGHAYEGYSHLSNFNLPVLFKRGVLDHHERYDGDGYPNRLKGEQISLFGRIISISDVYDALTSDRPYRKGLLPSEAMECIMGGGGSHFDPSLVEIFTTKVAPYPTGTYVLLSDGREGIVVENYGDCCMRPKIKIIRDFDENRKLIDVKSYMLDMRNDIKTSNVTIVNLEKQENHNLSMVSWWEDLYE